MTNQVFFIKKERILSLSGQGLKELLSEVLKKGKPFRFRAKGYSMSPFIKDGDVVTISPLFNTAPHYGDVLAYLKPITEKLIVHRMVGKKDIFYLIRADNSPEANDIVPKKNILGRVSKVERNGKKVLLGLGFEKFLIAFITQRRFLYVSLLHAWKLLRRFARFWNKVFNYLKI
jgi:hypothetical protein